MMMNEQSKREKLAAKILFWGVAVPTIFAVFLRIFFIFFNFVYGFLIVKIFGQDYANPVAGIALITSLGFTIGVLIWVYKQYKKHILATL
jgi:ABC-type Mn2+/Zn2+ transport system permease subunit